MRLQFIALLFGLAVLGTLAGCNLQKAAHFRSGPPGRTLTPPLPKFAYVPNANSANFSAYTINASTGALKPVVGSAYAAGSSPFGVTVHPSGRFAYVPNLGSNNVSAYTINASTGALTPVVGSPVAAGSNPFGVAVDPSGKF